MFLIGILLLTGNNIGKVMRDEAVQKHAAPPAVQTPGKVTITFDYQRMRAIASDQMAVWIEDGYGMHVCTLLVTRFTADGGYQTRAEAVPGWQKAFKPAANRDMLDTVSAATPPSGPVSAVWDCLDQTGRPVPAGTYVYKVEANIKWAKTSIWQGTITVGPKPGHSVAAPLGSDGTILQNVQADFIPAS